MTEFAARTRTCRYPGCDRPPAPAEDGVGRPPEYCDDPTHTRGAAWRARRDARAAAGAAVPDDLDRPVSMARARAAEYTEQVTAQVLTLTTTLNTVLEELRTLGDPDAAAVQIEAVTTEAEQRVAEVTARAARAERDQRAAESQRSEADAAAEEATDRADQLAMQLQQAQEAHRAAAEQWEQMSAQQQAEIARLKAALEGAAESPPDWRARSSVSCRTRSASGPKSVPPVPRSSRLARRR